MSRFIYPQSDCYVIYTFGINPKTNAVLKLLEHSYPVLIDCSKHFKDLDFIVSELNQLCNVKYNEIKEFEFPIVFKGLDLIGNYEKFIQHIKREIQ